VSPVPRSPEHSIVSLPQPASPIFSTSLAAESSRGAKRRHRSSFEHCLVASSLRQPQSAALFSPPTDMDTDVSVIMEQAANDSELFKSDVSFEVRIMAIKIRIYHVCLR